MSIDKPFLLDDNVRQKISFWGMIKKIWPYLMGHWVAFASVLVAVALFAASGRFLPIVFGYAIDEGIQKSSMTVIYYCAAAYFVLEALRALFGFLQNYYMQKLGNRVLFEIREQVVDHVQRLPVDYFDKTPTGRVVTRVTNDIASLGEFLIFGFTALTVNIFEIVAILVALALISWKLTVITLLVAPFLLVISAKLSRQIRDIYTASKKKLAGINAFTAESLNGIKIIQLFNMADKSRQDFLRLSDEYKGLQLKSVRLLATLWPILSGFNIGTVATALLIGGLYRDTLGLSIGNVSAFILLTQSFFQPLRVLLERYTQIQNSLAGADRVFNLLGQPLERQTGPQKLTHDEPGSIELRNLTFKYSETGPTVLKNIDLKISPGESIAIVGRTGSGKSTIISLLQGFYRPKPGQLFIDGVDVNDLDPYSLRSHLGVVRQDNFIFRGTLKSNIHLNDPSISEERVHQAAKDANCMHLVNRSALGFESPVEERGANLSQGERQLLAFARILAFDPHILILDEATANIDSINELRIQKATETVTRGRTSLIIAHRLSTILHCDRIVCLDQGQIIEVGSHSELLAQRGHYWNLYQSQFVNEQPPHQSSRLSLVPSDKF